MTNLQIVINECLSNNIYTAEQIEAYLSEGDIPMKTWSEWIKAGYVVKKGERGLKTRLWKLRPKKNSDDPDESQSDFILVNAYLFSIDQVVKAEKMEGRS